MVDRSNEPQRGVLHFTVKYHVSLVHAWMQWVPCCCHSYQHQQRQHLLSSIYTQVLSSAINSDICTACYQLIDKCTRQLTVSLLGSFSQCLLVFPFFQVSVQVFDQLAELLFL
jgi:hypothetical protein